MAGIGPATSPLPRECSTTEPHGPIQTRIWSGRRGSNSRHLVWKTNALPTELHPQHAHTKPTYSSKSLWWREKDSNLRTQRERIYSPSPLTTRPPLPTEPKIMVCLTDFVNKNNNLN